MPFVLVLAVALVAAGCGGDDASGDWPPSRRDLEAATLTIDDMPSGWTLGDDGGDSDPPCGNRLSDLLDLDEDDLPIGRFVAAENEGFGPAIREQIAVLPPDAPSDLLADFADGYLSCTDDIGDYRATYEELDLPEFGAESFGLRITVFDEAADRFFDHVFMREGDVFVGVQVYDQYGDREAFLAEYGPKALDRAVDRLT